MFSRSKTSKTPLSFFLSFLLISVLVFTRFYHLDWGEGHFFHPDENNMARAISGLSFQNLNPRFFAYGQFPLYLSFFTGQLLNFFSGRMGDPLSFSSSVYLLRFWSATFSIFTALLIQFVYKTLFPKSRSRLPLLLAIFTPGLIQIGYFGTTESLLCFLFLLNIYLSLRLIKKGRLSIGLILAGTLVTGLGLATKLSAIFFAGPILLALFFHLLSSKKKNKILLVSLFYLFLSLFLGTILSPYNYLSKKDFQNTMKYEIGVAQGTPRVFYTHQFEDTQPYLYQFQKIYPYAIGLPLLIFSLFSLPLLLKTKKPLPLKKWLLLFVPVLVYFIYNAQLYTKWTRFMAPTFFIFPFLSAYFIDRISQKKLPQSLLIFFTIISIIPGFMFLDVRFSKDTRVQATNWMQKNIPADSKVLSEAGNVVNLPLDPVSFSINNFHFYDLNQKTNSASLLASALEEADYILIPSRRIFANHYSPEFPVIEKYYQKLFSDNLGFVHLKTFSAFPRLSLREFPLLVLPDEYAEETWSVFDHPVVRIYKKTDFKTKIEYQQLLTIPE